MPLIFYYALTLYHYCRLIYLLKYFYPLLLSLMACSPITNHLIISLIILLFSLPLTSSRDCTVTQTVTLTDCVMLCWDTYQGKKDFYDFNSGTCQQRITCGPGYYNDYVNNICIDQFGGYVLKEIGWIITVKENHVRFAQIQVLKGYFVSHKLICDDGWKSSMRTQKRNQMTLIIYLCDQKIKDGEIYPKTHGEYFFQQLTHQQKLAAIDAVFGADSFSSILTVKMNIFLLVTSIYLILNFIACCGAVGKKTKCKLFGKKQPLKVKQKKLTQSENKQVEDYLQKRKQQHMKPFQQIKQFSLQGEIKDQFQIMNKIKQESQEIMKKKWEKQLQKKQQQKQNQFNQEKQQQQKKQKKQQKENKPIEIFKFLRSTKKKQEKQNLPLQSKLKPNQSKLKTSSIVSSCGIKPMSKNSIVK